jgi:AraC-like DNA-binding protein
MLSEMRAVRLSPGPALAPFVHSLGYYEVDGPAVRERALPTGAMQLLVNLYEDELRTHTGEAGGRRVRGAALQGAYTRPVTIDTAQQRAIAVVCFRPGGAFPFFGAPPSATADQLVEVEALWGRAGAVLRERLLEAADPRDALRVLETALLESAARPLEPDPAIACAVAALERGARVDEVVERLGMSPRRLIRRFREQVGQTPKRFGRVRRFQRALAAIPYGRPVDWAATAVDCGYYDQAHLIHDFRAFAGTTPSGYRPRSPREPNHVPL